MPFFLKRQAVSTADVMAACDTFPALIESDYVGRMPGVGLNPGQLQIGQRRDELREGEGRIARRYAHPSREQLDGYIHPDAGYTRCLIQIAHVLGIIDTEDRVVPL